ncbi:MAG: hypothetical protein J5793_02540, partial [Clostridia bacterium]|nr:hypothetical protein [Clostridia bacterium]
IAVFRLSGIIDVTDENGERSYTVYAPYDDVYSLFCDEGTVSLYKDGALIACGNGIEAELKENDIVTLKIETAEANARFELKAQADNNLVTLPYDTGKAADVTEIPLESGEGDPLVPAKIDYVKREGGTYVYCNNPEMVPDQNVGEAFMRDEGLTGEIYMTFEHANYSKAPFYLGYQLKNEGDSDVYVTVLNIGYQTEGTWFGQRAWYDFYNVSFKLPDDYLTSNGTITAKYANLDYAYRNYVPRVFRPVTYRLPPYEYFYVIGGTSADAYMNISVDNSADRPLGTIRCANGNVRFSVAGGSVTGTMYCYTDPSQVVANPEAKGYRTGAYAGQYLGTADHAGVIDNYMTWTFNDSTRAGTLPVTYTNYYAEKVPRAVSPYSAYNSTPHTVKKARSWMTHLNPQNSHDAVGTDMVAFNCVDDHGRRVTVDNDHADGAGDPANTANWMIEYQDHFLLVNQGDKERTVTFSMKDNGSLAMLVRDKDGNILEARLTAGQAESSVSYEYRVTVAPHSVTEITLDYVLVACSFGSVTHRVTLR